MTILVWNCRGLGRPAAVRAVNDVIRSHQALIVGLIETKRRRTEWDLLRCRLGFLNCFAVDRVGLSGGLVLLWREGIEVQVRNFSRFHIDAVVSFHKSFRLTLFYGNPLSSRRRDSWDLIRSLKEGWSGPWMIAGDFNEVLFSWEAKGIGGGMITE